MFIVNQKCLHRHWGAVADKANYLMRYCGLFTEIRIFVLMERLTINIPDAKSAEIKSFLNSMGVAVDGPKLLDMDAYRAKIAGIGHWSDEELKAFEENRQILGSFKSQEW